MIPNFRVHKSYFNTFNVVDSIENGWGKGRSTYIEKCEQNIKAIIGRKYAVMFSNATTALTAGLSYLASNNYIFITPNKTWIGSVTPALRNNYHVGLINTRSPFYISESDIPAISYFAKEMNSKVVLCNVDLMGLCANHSVLEDLCSKNGWTYLVDAAESLGSLVNGIPSARFGFFSTISFNATKIISGTGGGILLTDNLDLANYAASYRNNFQDYQTSKKYFWSYQLGTNANISNILASHIYSQLGSLDALVASRRAIHHYYKSELGDLVIDEPDYCYSNYWHTCINASHFRISCEQIIEVAYSKGVELRPGFYKISEQSIFNRIENVTQIHQDAVTTIDYICLPAGDITEEELSIVVNVITEIYCEYKAI